MYQIGNEIFESFEEAILYAFEQFDIDWSGPDSTEDEKQRACKVLTANFKPKNESKYCWACNGSGEWQHEGSCCPTCKGRGVLLPEPIED